MSTTALSVLTGVIAATEEAAHELPMPPYMFGVIALALLLLALLVTYFFRGTSQKWAHEGDDVVEPFHGTHPGAKHH